jgi:hypothetical protein
MNNRPNDELGPRPEQLAAYVDGELDPFARMQIDSWLADHPEAAREVEAQHRLIRLWQQTRPADPAESTWALAAARSAERLIPVARMQPRAAASRGSWLPAIRPVTLRTVALGALAATLFLAISLGPLPPQPDKRPVAEDYPVLSPDDVEINSLDPADSGALVVGEAPLQEPFVAASAGDVRLISIRPALDGVVPQLRIASEPSSVPMIVAPIRHNEPRKSAP